MLDCWLCREGGTNAGEVELREKDATCWGCCVGEELGELLDREGKSLLRKVSRFWLDDIAK